MVNYKAALALVSKCKTLDQVYRVARSLRRLHDSDQITVIDYRWLVSHMYYLHTKIKEEKESKDND